MARAARDKTTGCTDREEVFCQAIAYDPELNDSDAYRQAYNTERMKPETVNNKAYALKNKAHIGARIAVLREERCKRTQIDADYVLQRHREIDEMDVIDIMDDDGGLLPVRQWPKVWRQFISGMDVSELFDGRGDEKAIVGVMKKIKWPDKIRNLELMGKHVDVQAYKEKLEHGGSLEVTEVRRTIVDPKS
ncbi:terminase small subunit [Marinobacterium litorale]|uniref:terminase small subunit n=1 Tax=Marinobacterium litorale TaxID=404770 RepID=UPI0004847884|nr:terminase small subunit [Marinobacterium litorale]